MNESAKLIPDNENTVLFMRHAERYTNPPDGNYSYLLLTPDGIKEANNLGAAIDRKVRTVMSSPVERCRQTIKEIVRCIPQKFAPDEAISENSDVKTEKEFGRFIGNPDPIEKGGVGWYQFFHYLQVHDTVSARGVTSEQETKRIIDAIFRCTLDSERKAASDDSNATLDIICSHDGHVVVLAGDLFGLRTDKDGWSEEWCKYAEGIFFTGTRKDFTAYWRGQKKRFVDYYM